MEHVAEETPAPDYEPDEHVFAACGPVVLCQGTVAGEVSANGEGVCDLKEGGEEPDDGVDGGHGGVEEKGREDGAVDVVYDLYDITLTMALVFRPDWRERRGSSGTYKTSSHRPISPRQLTYPQLLGQTVHNIQQRDESHRLHRRPPNLAINVEARLCRCLALRVPV